MINEERKNVRSFLKNGKRIELHRKEERQIITYEEVVGKNNTVIMISKESIRNEERKIITEE